MFARSLAANRSFTRWPEHRARGTPPLKLRLVCTPPTVGRATRVRRPRGGTRPRPSESWVQAFITTRAARIADPAGARGEARRHARHRPRSHRMVARWCHPLTSHTFVDRARPHVGRRRPGRRRPPSRPAAPPPHLAPPGPRKAGECATDRGHTTDTQARHSVPNPPSPGATASRTSDAAPGTSPVECRTLTADSLSWPSSRALPFRPHPTSLPISMTTSPADSSTAAGWRTICRTGRHLNAPRRDGDSRLPGSSCVSKKTNSTGVPRTHPSASPICRPRPSPALPGQRSAHTATAPMGSSCGHRPPPTFATPHDRVAWMSPFVPARRLIA